MTSCNFVRRRASPAAPAFLLLISILSTFFGKWLDISGENPKSSNFIGVDRIILYSTWGAELTCEAFGVMTIGLVNYTYLEAAGKSESLPHDTIYLVSDHHTEKI